MKLSEVHSLSYHALTVLAQHCERLIQENQAALEDYDLYVLCQQELAKRARQPKRAWRKLSAV